MRKIWFPKPAQDNGHVLIFHDADKKNGYLSNWYPSRFSDGRVWYNCMEQYLMYQKARFFDDKAAMKKILDADDPAIMKEIGRNVRGFSYEAWESVRWGVLCTGLWFKFTDNPRLARKLIRTGHKILCEGTDTDMIYANGLRRDDPDRFKVEKWEGLNLLGYALMDVRSELQRGKH